MKTITIALLQLMPGKSIKENLQKGLDACRQAKVMGRISLCFRKCGAPAMGFRKIWTS